MLRSQYDRQILGVAESNGPPAPVFITIFLGANDACLIGDGTYVPIDEYEEHIRYYVSSILEHPATKGSKIILISPPPVDVGIPPGAHLMDNPAIASVLVAGAKTGRGHRTWLSKRQFAQKVVEIGREFEAKTDLVALFDFWTVVRFRPTRP
jgi:lysophospholipase L1-like esterase